MVVIKRATDLMNTHILIFCTHTCWSSEHTHTDLIKHILIWAHTDLTNNEHIPTFRTDICKVFWFNTHTSLPNTDLNKHKTYFENTHICTYVSSEKTLAYLFGWIQIQSLKNTTKKTNKHTYLLNLTSKTCVQMLSIRAPKQCHASWTTVSHLSYVYICTVQLSSPTALKQCHWSWTTESHLTSCV